MMVVWSTNLSSCLGLLLVLSTNESTLPWGGSDVPHQSGGGVNISLLCLGSVCEDVHVQLQGWILGGVELNWLSDVVLVLFF